MSVEDYVDVLQTYAKSHRRMREDGFELSWIDENLNTYTGEWEGRRKLFLNDSNTYRGKGMIVLVDGKVVFHSPHIEKAVCSL